MRFPLLHVIVLTLLGGVGFLTEAAPSLTSAPSPMLSTSPTSPTSLLTARDDFDTHTLTRQTSSPSRMSTNGTGLPGTGPTSSRESSLSLGEPGRFFMQQSYSLSAMSGPVGSASSGLYLNTLNYRFTPLMTAFVDVGFQTPIHSSIPGVDQAEGVGSLVIPRIGLEYRPSDRLSFNFEVVNGPDAWNSWGGSPSGSSLFRSYPGSRIP